MALGIQARPRHRHRDSEGLGGTLTHPTARSLTTSARLSVVVLTDRYSTIRRLVDHLLAQTLAEDIELVVGCPVAKDLELPADTTHQLACVRVIEVPLLPMGRARAAVVRAATAPVVVLGETHAFPAPSWAAQLLRAHQGRWQAVAPGMANANPETARSWAGFLMDYGRWLAERTEAEIDEPPAYNASWKREALMSVNDRLAVMLEPGGPLDKTLAAGADFRHAPDARVSHLNVVRPLAWAAERYWAGRLLGARRRGRWPLWRRVVYFGGSVLVPIVLFTRTHRSLRVAARGRRLPRATVVAIAGGSVLWAIGEALGYLAGEGRAEVRMMEYEVHKEWYA